MVAQEIALYYPYIHFRDEEWLKSAILYWPRVARIAPTRSGPRDSELVRTLCDTGIVINAQAGSATKDVSEQFAKFVLKYQGSLANSYGLDRQLIVSATTVGSRSFGHDEAASQTLHVNSAAPLRQKPSELDYVWIDEGAMEGNLIADLSELNLVERRLTRDGVPWLAMNRRLASVYKCALADQVARRNDMQVVTDQPREHAVLNGWTVEAIAHTLLRDDAPETDSAASIAEIFAMLAIKGVVPDLSRIGIAQILQARHELEPEFFTFRQYLASLGEAFAEIAIIEDPSVRAARLEILDSEEIQPKVRLLEKQIRNAKLEPLSAIFSLKTLAPPAVIAAASAQLGLGPMATASGAIATCLIASLRNVQTRVGTERSSSPVAYLLGLSKHLTTGRSIQIAQAMFKRQRLLT